MGSCYPWGSFVYLATFFHRSLYFIRFRISVVTKELGSHKVWLSFKEYACLLHHWIIDWNYAFSLSLGLSKTFRTRRLRYLRNISIELIWPAIFEASCCNITWFRAGGKALMFQLNGGVNMGSWLLIEYGLFHKR